MPNEMGLAAIGKRASNIRVQRKVWVCCNTLIDKENLLQQRKSLSPEKRTKSKGRGSSVSSGRRPKIRNYAATILSSS